MNVETLDLGQLIELLADLEGRRTPVGWTPDDAVIKSSVERRILESVAANPPKTPASDARIPCSMPIALRTKDESMPTEVLGFGVGGVFIQGCDGLPIGTHVHLDVKSGSDEHGLRARGIIGWREKSPVAGVGIDLSEQPSAAHERRLRRFVLELVRHSSE